MGMLTGRVVNGKIEVDGVDLREGAVVCVLVHEDGETVDVTPEEEDAILAAIAEAERGETIPWEEVLHELRRSR